MTNLSVSDRAFDIQVTSSYYMSIQANLNGLSFCVLDPVTNRYIHFHHQTFPKADAHQAQLEEALMTNPYLNLPYKKVLFLYYTSRFALVPNPLYSQDSNAELLTFSGHVPTQDDRIVVNKIKMADASNVFCMPNFLYHMVKNQFGEVKFYQQCTPLIESLLTRKITGRPQLMHIHFQDGFFVVIVIQNHTLKLCNSFRFTDNKEMLYMVLFVLEQMELNPDHTAVEVSGSIHKLHSGYLLLQKYLKQIQQSPLPLHFQYAETIAQHDPLPYINLFNLPLCV